MAETTIQPLKICVTCHYAALNPPANAPMPCNHPDSPLDPIYGHTSTCKDMRSLRGACGPHADLWAARVPVPRRVSLGRRMWRAITGSLS